jgi:hypothetical protein
MWEMTDEINKHVHRRDRSSPKVDCNFYTLRGLLLRFGWERSAFEGVPKAHRAGKITVQCSHIQSLLPSDVGSYRGASEPNMMDVS